MSTPKDASALSIDSSDKPRLSLRRERVRTLHSVRTGIRTGLGGPICPNNSCGLSGPHCPGESKVVAA